MPAAVLLVSCPDRPGLVHAVTGFVLAQGGTIVHAEQHIDAETGVFFQRVEFETPGTAAPDADRLAAEFAPIAERFAMTVRVGSSDDRLRTAVLASRQPHCLADLLGRWRSGELPAEIVAVVSNHRDHEVLAAFHGVPYHYLPVGPGPGGGDVQETALLEILAGACTELVVLARYMQILGPRVLDAYPARIINIHHSFLPAFVGARPYHQAQQRGVKLIGATAHYATAELDEGPIIAQDVTPVSHRDSVSDLVRKGRDLETVVLARAVRAHLEHRTLVFGNKTIVFG
jgi:formyltetrahydrofolate deformylase